MYGVKGVVFDDTFCKSDLCYFMNTIMMLRMMARWQSVGLAHRRCDVRLPARSLPCKNLGQVSYTHVQ